jgi:methyltransferase
MTSSQGWYLLLVAAVAIERLGELATSRRHERRLRARGAVEHGARHYPAMVAVHAGVLVAAPLEVLLRQRPLVPLLAAGMLAVVAATMALRYWVVATLGERWTTRVLVVTGAPLVTAGPYRLLRHPNYLGVALEVPALALVHTAWATALIFGAANLAVLGRRLAVEEEALAPGRASPAGSEAARG